MNNIMNDIAQTRPDSIPSFSIILETENLAINNPEKLISCIQTLKSQSISPAFANEILVVQSGDIPESLLIKLKEQFPWAQIVNADENTRYYEAKMEYVKAVTGDVVVFCDSDCVYVTDWLESMLTPFGDDKVNIVTGETFIPATSLYTFSVTLSWFLPPPSNKKELYVTTGYAANNVAFRRQFILEHPVPCDLDISRGNCAIHARAVRKLGYKIWKHPKARAIHPYPRASQYLLRFYLMGHNKLMGYRLAETNKEKNWFSSTVSDLYYSLIVISRQIIIPFYRLPSALICKPKNFIYLPASVIIVLGATLSFMSGVFISLVRPGMRLTEFASKMDFD